MNIMTVALRSTGSCRNVVFQNRNLSSQRIIKRLVNRATGDKNSPDDDFESMFARELQRRGLEGSSSDEAPQSDTGAKKESINPVSASSASRPRARSPPPMSSIPVPEIDFDDQRQRSIGLVNEGLSGLIPRVKVLFQLGGSVFLGFLPFMLAFSLLFTGIYAVFGDSFLHGGRVGSGPPPYVDPEVLLSKPTMDPYVPYR